MESADQNSSGEDKISLSSEDQLIVGVVIGVVVLMLAILVTMVICMKKKRKGVELNDIATNIKSHQWKQTPRTGPLPSLPNEVYIDEKLENLYEELDHYLNPRDGDFEAEF